MERDREKSYMCMRKLSLEHRVVTISGQDHIKKVVIMLQNESHLRNKGTEKLKTEKIKNKRQKDGE